MKPTLPVAQPNPAADATRQATPPRILIVKLSSLGDVVHTMPAVQDIHRLMPEAHIDWVVERAFAPLVAHCVGVRTVIPCDLRQWRAAPLTAQTRQQWRAFRSQLGATDYHVVIDAQGLAKSALVARLARLAPGGKRFALANRTSGSSYEAPTRWAADVAVRVDAKLGAVARARALCAQALELGALTDTIDYGLALHQHPSDAARELRRTIAFVHGSSRADKCWPESDWAALGQRLNAAGWQIVLPQGNEAEQQASERIAAQLPDAQVWPRLPLDRLVERLARCAAVIGVDSGLSHIAVALNLPHVQIYNFDTAWRTGPGPDAMHQRAVFGEPVPTIEAVWRAWCAVAPVAPEAIAAR